MKSLSVFMKRHGWLALPTLSGLLYAGVVWSCSVNFPLWDDYYAFLDFVQLQATGVGMRARIVALFEQHYEHRVATSRLLAWLWYALCGSVNIRGLVLLANACYLGWAGWLVWLGHRRWEVPVLALGTWCFFAFNLSQYEVSLWATTSMFFYLVYLFAFAGIYFFFQEKRYAIVVALAAGLCAAFSGANGLLLFPAAAVVHLLRVGRLNKRVVIWLAGFAFAALLYAWHYERPAHQPSIVHTLLQQPAMAVRYFLVLSGNVFNWGKNAALVWGLVAACILLWLLWQRPWKHYPVLFGMLVFVLLTMLATTAGRMASGAGQAFTPRYCSFSTVYAGLLSMLVVAHLQGRARLAAMWAFACFACAGWANSYRVQVPVLARQKQEFVSDMARVQQGKLSGFRYGSLFDNTSRARAWLRQYDSSGVFPFRFTDPKALFERLPVAQEPLWNLQRANVTSDPAFFFIKVWVKPLNAANAPAYAALELPTDGSLPPMFVMLRRDETSDGTPGLCYGCSLLPDEWQATQPGAMLWLTDERTRQACAVRLK